MGWIKLEYGLNYIPTEINKVPKYQHGIYLICERENDVRLVLRYIGRTKKPRLQERLRDHLQGKDKNTNQRLYNFMKDDKIAKVFYYWITAKKQEAEGREASLLGKYYQKPGYDLFNQQGAGDDVAEVDTELPLLLRHSLDEHGSSASD